MREFRFRIWCAFRFVHDCYLYNGQPYTWNHEETELVPLQTEDQKRVHGEAAIEQYTGLKDKNGKEIYEGDIVKDQGEYWQDRIRQVIYAEGHFIPLVTVEYGYNCIDSFDASEWEVIGNIHEHPALLDESQAAMDGGEDDLPL